SSECSKCPAGTYASESGSSKCHDCDLNFALKRRIGMAHCDLCPDSGSTFGTEKCHRKLRMSCEGYRYYDFLLKGCKKSIDNDLKTYGVLTYGEGISSKGEGGGSLFSRYYYKYTLDQIASVKGLISWQGDPVDSTSLEIILKDSNKNHIKNCKTKVDILNPYSVHCSAFDVKFLAIAIFGDTWKSAAIYIAEIALYAE
uniref:Ephrin_rec_like domain-containing protein n=1 Tax=Macrostomum lignano TaxID=282301 RepID=A0A1I8GJH0_9PLAT